MSARLVSLDAKLSDVCPQVQTRIGWAAHTVVVPVSGVDSTTAVQRVAEARKRIAEDTTQPLINYHIEARHHSKSGRHGRHHSDSRPWRSEVSRHHHSSMGYYRVAPTASISAAGTLMPVNAELSASKHAVVVHQAESSIVDAAIQSVIAENPDMTVRQFIDTPEYRLAVPYVKQNCLRLAAQLGAALTSESPASVMKIASDMRAAEEPGFAPPVYAVATHISATNYFETNLPAVLAGEETAGKVLFYDGATSTLVGEHIQIVDTLSGLVVKARTSTPPAAAASIGAPMTAAVMRETPGENLSLQTFVTGLGHERARLDIQRRFVNAEGEKPSRADKAFYSRDGLPNVAGPNDLRLEPVGVSINSKPSKQQ